MDNHLSELTPDEFRNVKLLWREVLQNRAFFDAIPDAIHYYRMFAKERQKRAVKPVYKPLRGVSSYGSRQALHRACGDSTFAHYYDTRKW